MKTKLTCLVLALWLLKPGLAQTIITDVLADSSEQSSAILDVRSTSKGLLTPRMTSAQRLAIGSPAEGLIVYQTDQRKGFYFWNGNNWQFTANSSSLVVKAASDTLDKTETFVVGKNDIKLILPAITNADDGLEISIKHAGSHTDLISVFGNGAATIDGGDSTNLYRFMSETYVANKGEWLIKDKFNKTEGLFEVSGKSSWTTINEVLEFLSEHMTGPSVIRLSAGEYPITATHVIDLPYPVTIQGLTYSSTTLTAAPGLTGSPMFICESETYFKMLILDGSTLNNYGTAVGEDAIRLSGDDKYYEIKDIVISHFNKAVVILNTVELWMFECDVYDCVYGIDVRAGSGEPFLKVSQVDFYNCTRGVCLTSGTNGTFSINGSGFYANTATDIAVCYVPGSFTFTDVFITGNTWNQLGKFIDGFDFTRSDARDGNAYIQDNAGYPDQTPQCKIDVINNSSTTTLTNNTTWYKANWTNTNTIVKHFTVTGNKFTYQSKNSRNLLVMISGNLSVNNNNRTVSVMLLKNGSTQHGETTLRLTTASQAFQFATIIYLQDVKQGDYFEVYCKSANGYDVVTFQDVHLFAESK